MYYIISLLCGLIFGIGLTISRMINPNKIQDFLDITGNWDASLAFVMLGAVSITFIGYYFIFQIARPKLADKFFLPEKKSIDVYLILGAILFGIGWGAAGYCPGPALTAIGLRILDAFYFVLGMLASVFIYPLVSNIIKKKT